MKKLLTTFCALALSVTVANAQTTQGTMTFGVSDNFTTASTGTDANVGYFIMDGIMLSANFHMDMAEDGDTNWGFGARYYYGEDGLWGGLSAKNSHHIHDGEEEEEVNMMIQVGYSKALGMDGKLWFEPTLDYDMADDGSIGLGAGFRLAF